MSNLGRKLYKVILIGDPSVGKTSLRKRYFGEGFKETYMPTLGADFALRRKENSVIQIWDLAGQYIYRRLRKGYYQGAHGAILVFDVLRDETFMNLNKWLDEIHHFNGKMMPLVIIGNKIDLLPKGNGFDDTKALQLVNNLKDKYALNFPFMTSSALDGTNVEAMFDKLIEEIASKRQ